MTSPTDNPCDKLIFIFSLANFKPNNWETTIVPALKQGALNLELSHYLDTVLRLISLDYYDENMIKRVFDEQFWHESLLEQRTNSRNHFKLLKIYQSVAINSQINQNIDSSPEIQKRLIRMSNEFKKKHQRTKLDSFIPVIFEKKYFLTSIWTPNDQFIEFMFKFDMKRNELATFSENYPDKGLTLYQDIKFNADEVL